MHANALFLPQDMIKIQYFLNNKMPGMTSNNNGSE